VSLKNIGSAPVADLTRSAEQCLRRFLRTTVARFGLAIRSDVRLDAVTDMIRSLDETTVELLRQRAGVETDTAVKHEIETGLHWRVDAPMRRRASGGGSAVDRFSQDVANRCGDDRTRPGGVTAETDPRAECGERRCSAHRFDPEPLCGDRDALFGQLGPSWCSPRSGCHHVGVMGVINMCGTAS